MACQSQRFLKNGLKTSWGSKAALRLRTVGLSGNSASNNLGILLRPILHKSTWQMYSHRSLGGMYQHYSVLDSIVCDCGRPLLLSIWSKQIGAFRQTHGGLVQIESLTWGDIEGIYELNIIHIAWVYIGPRQWNAVLWLCPSNAYK